MSPLYNELFECDLNTGVVQTLYFKPNISFNCAYYLSGQIIVIACDMDKIGVNTDEDIYLLKSKGNKYLLDNICPDYDLGIGNSVRLIVEWVFLTLQRWYMTGFIS